MQVSLIFGQNFLYLLSSCNLFHPRLCFSFTKAQHEMTRRYSKRGNIQRGRNIFVHGFPGFSWRCLPSSLVVCDRWRGTIFFCADFVSLKRNTMKSRLRLENMMSDVVQEILTASHPGGAIRGPTTWAALSRPSWKPMTWPFSTRRVPGRFLYFFLQSCNFIYNPDITCKKTIS
jgi:hypothetical protein